MTTTREKYPDIDADAIRKGIAAYGRDQKVILRLLRKRGSFTEREFDNWFRHREWRRPIRFNRCAIDGGSFILGVGANGGNEWARMLELTQCMMALGLVDAKIENGMVVYRLGSNIECME